MRHMWFCQSMFGYRIKGHGWDQRRMVDDDFATAFAAGQQITLAEAFVTLQSPPN